MLFLLAYITIICHLTVVEANTISALMHETLAKNEMDDAMIIDVSKMHTKILIKIQCVRFDILISRWN